MPQLRLLHPQFVLPAWTAPQWRQTLRLHSSKPTPTTQHNPPSPTPSPTPSPPRRTTRPLSLLEELFPEEAQKRTEARTRTHRKEAERHIPPLPLSPDADGVDPTPRRGSIGLPRRKNGRIGTLTAEALRRKETTIMVLRNASKSLSENDFRRVVPKGRHIEGWKGQGDIMKVIPVRDPSTLQPVGHYFLLFSTPASARVYQDHLVHLHRMARTHTPRSIESPIAPPPGYMVEGEDVYQLLQEYALIAASQRLSLKLLLPPYSAMVTSLVEHGGYRQLVDGTGKAANAVLFWVEGFQPSTFFLKEVIARDGRDRALLWEIAGEGGGITKLEVPVAATTDHEGEAEDEGETRQTRRVVARWVIKFKNEAEARRFVRSWHRRPFPLHRDSAVYGEPPPLANAEFLW